MLVSIPGCRGWNPAANRLSYDTAHSVLTIDAGKGTGQIRHPTHLDFWKRIKIVDNN
jgi:hypothetical protein